MRNKDSITINRLLGPPGFFTRMMIYLTRNEATLDSSSVLPELFPAEYSTEKNLLFLTVLEALRNLGWDVIEKNDSHHSIAALIKTRWFHFKDDIFIEIIVGREGGSALKIRSTSRVGIGDFGANSKHILDLVGEVESLLAGNRYD